ncbi:MAG: hypothetical protein JWR51_2914 [Devosia sp.]|uniref:hypothetical protein n=1 Tax=Devosia sp. TaxID=1871048 RepID=UPI0026322C09|nr:hypothetical protein [Devosia sp.]MDB5529811.1 hypothetical protein [Devosia sp.]
MRLPILASLIILFGAAPVFASGGVVCTSGAGLAQFEVSISMGRDFGAGILNIGGELIAKIPNVAPDLRQLHFAPENPNQIWIDRDVVYFEISIPHRGDGPYGYADLMIKTQSVDEGSYVGTYVLDIYDAGVEVDGVPQNITVDGAVSCMTD